MIKLKILIGVCGIGYGHSVREYELASQLRKRGHKVIILTCGNGETIFKNGAFRTERVWIPWVSCGPSHFNWITNIQKNIFTCLPGIIQNLRILIKLKQEKFIPDICISDYEPTTARLAYLLRRPLVIIDQQSKYWYYDFKPILQYSRKEEKRRLHLFFPKFQKRFIISFFKLPKSKDFRVEILPPIFSKSLKERERQRKKIIVVYFSTYGNSLISQSLEEILSIFKSIKEYEFILYLPKEVIVNHKNTQNIIIKGTFTRDFVMDLKKSCALITSAGQTLLSEALYLKIPAYIIPLKTYDQHFCAKFIKDHHLGYSTELIKKESLKRFLRNLPKYRENIKKCRHLNFGPDPIPYVIKYLEEKCAN